MKRGVELYSGDTAVSERCRTMLSTPRCPQCDGALSERGAHFPFCSARCRSLDLGAWASGRYAIPAESIHPRAEEFADEASVELRTESPASASKKKG